MTATELRPQPQLQLIETQIPKQTEIAQRLISVNELSLGGIRKFITTKRLDRLNGQINYFVQDYIENREVASSVRERREPAPELRPTTRTLQRERRRQWSKQNKINNAHLVNLRLKNGYGVPVEVDDERPPNDKQELLEFGGREHERYVGATHQTRKEQRTAAKGVRRYHWYERKKARLSGQIERSGDGEYGAGKAIKKDISKKVRKYNRAAKATLNAHNVHEATRFNKEWEARQTPAPRTMAEVHTTSGAAKARKWAKATTAEKLAEIADKKARNAKRKVTSTDAPSEKDIKRSRKARTRHEKLRTRAERYRRERRELKNKTEEIDVSGLI